MSTPTVSIVMPSYNASASIASSIESVTSQSYSDWELLVVDDCSTDTTLAVVKRLMKIEPRIKLLLNKSNSGPARSRNKAISEAKGRYIAFLDADDLWMPNKLKKQIHYMQEHKVALSFTAAEVWTEGFTRKLKEWNVPGRVTYEELLLTNVIVCSSAMYDSDALQKKYYMPDILKRQDYGLWLSIIADCGCGSGINEMLVKYQKQSNTVSSNKFVAAIYQWKIYRNVLNLKLGKALWCFINYACRGLKKHM